jgi:Furry protein C-terminal
MIFKFDFKGESIDNFNWGVRRPSLSHLDGGAGSGLDGELSSAQESFNEVTPVLPKRETNAGVGAEESSDDETGSITVRFFLLTKVLYARDKYAVDALNV